MCGNKERRWEEMDRDRPVVCPEEKETHDSLTSNLKYWSDSSSSSLPWLQSLWGGGYNKTSTGGGRTYKATAH